MKTGQLLELRPAADIEGLSDDGLVAACATGDRAARALLFERHVDAIHRFIARMHASDADVIDDLVQATFIAAFQGAARFRGPQVRTWLIGIAVNVVRTYARGEIRRKRAMSSFGEVAVGLCNPPDPDLARLPSAIAKLGHNLRAALVLVDLEGQSGRDAASALGIPEGTLWRRVFFARRALREALGGPS